MLRWFHASIRFIRPSNLTVSTSFMASCDALVAIVLWMSVHMPVILVGLDTTKGKRPVCSTSPLNELTVRGVGFWRGKTIQIATHAENGTINVLNVSPGSSVEEQMVSTHLVARSNRARGVDFKAL